MSEPLSTDPYKGVRDFYPADWAMMEALFARVRETLATWGYEEYNASPLERAELYEAKTSEEIVNEQTYTFTDRGDRKVTLRPEMTPTLARMVAGKRRELALPLRWFSIGNRFRYERPQKGRLREFYQADIDLIGLPEGEADIEIIRLASEILKAFGATEKDFIIRMNSRALLNAACAAAGLKGEAVRRYLRLLDKKSKMRPEKFKLVSESISKKDPLSLIDSTSMEELAKTLKKRGVENVVFDPGITRGFDYYTGMVFEVFDTNPANPRALFGGGRYDNLISLFSGGGGEAVPAVGFALGDVTLGDFLETHSLTLKTGSGTSQLYLGTPSPSDIPSAQAFADTLRAQDCRVFVNLTDRALGDQIKDAVKRGIPFFAAYGADEVKNETVRLKILATSEEVVLPISDLPKRLRPGA
ncbi:histidine--tRNA ligase [Candidatus Kaiserbacteria bacterium RIFCSPLOWO2_02_FULL_54_13]|uniref:Histidine--tRNA ligase n=1 Tax=Candidatus Kaiserbacteria bacterium RIFCSPHIGHO2_02_FULL_54_22 TaxID=1798495 RepID=A0A1F6DJJ4_9BACT|nr:MAG: Histidine-tRNA ligase [Parcubacteria group bacterium GW2011_GWB1_55_9]OGG61588.1 MAG: histidine--tRNA ligase [Candidatus Kaiserbacteria bacterium RIFCSPHIGHO2_02_FULL_54_22]OGG68957.1 MAG: histidine--tRNA ligase [Candidatus Kaiserbacteria bacterium RIFCSPHIGHO2_12_FULL_54_16]OGG82478.1 MAG: histidine--tRNA ligase [Candidatus Kaiserbacteria bacterium RIFCSPLOWO2_02_FULL_54_13]